MRRHAVIVAGALALVVTATLAGASPILAEDTAPLSDLVIGYPPPCSDEEAATLSAVECAGVESVDALGPIPPEVQAAADETARVETSLVQAEGPDALRKNCRLHAEVAFYTDADWSRLATNLAAETSHCADYYISLPAVAGNKTMPRGGGQPAGIRAHGPRFHAMAEAHLGAWQTWVVGNGKTWTEAGRLFRQRMEDQGYDISSGDLWALNEVPSSVRQNAGQARQNLLDFLEGLQEGDGTAPTQGLVFVVGLGQRTQNLSVYLANMRGWLADSAFWTEAESYVRFWAQEVYGDVRAWGVPGSPRMTRTEHIVDYVMHPLALARAGGERSAAAEAFFRRTYLPLENAAWKWQSGFGFTNVDHLLMRHFVSEQVHAARHDAGTHPADGPSGRVGFAWAPENNPAEPDFPAKAAGIQQRLASAFANAYAQGASSQMGACGPPGGHVWCEGEYEGAAFNEGWEAFSSWDE
jgi:hypothetical protein